MEQFLIAAIGVVAVVLALILASQRGARTQGDGASRRPARPMLIVAVGFLLVLASAAVALSALGWRGAEMQRRALAAEHRALEAKVKEMAARQRRAWVHATAALDGPMIIKGRAVSLAAHYRLDTSGDAPATDIRVASAVVPRETGDIAAVQRSLCARPPIEGETGRGQDTLFPGQSRDIRRVEGVGADLVAGGVQRAAAGVEFWWVGCIAYRSAGSTAEHHSGFWYGLAEAGAGPGGIVPIGLADRIIPKARLAVMPHSGGFPAN